MVNGSQNILYDLLEMFPQLIFYSMEGDDYIFVTGLGRPPASNCEAPCQNKDVRLRRFPAVFDCQDREGSAGSVSTVQV